ncbi:hypothetical protein MC885_007277, partial [Smutsia gigantea]
GGQGGQWRAQKQAARQLVGRGPRDQGVAARACAERLSAPVTERRGVGERDLARPAWPPPLGLPLRPRGASRAARPLSGGRARPGVAQKPSSNSPWREAKFFLTSTVTKDLEKVGTSALRCHHSTTRPKTAHAGHECLLLYSSVILQINT